MRVQTLKKIVFSLIIVALLIFWGISYIKNQILKPFPTQPSTPSEISLPIFEKESWSKLTNISHTPPPVSIKEGGRVIYSESPILAVDSNDVLHAIWIEQEKEGVKETLELEVWDQKFNIKKYFSYSFKKNGVWSNPVQLFEFKETQPAYFTKDKIFTKFTLVTDKNNTLHLIWSLTEAYYEPVKRGETPATRIAKAVIDKNIFYSQKLKNGKWSEPEVIFNPQEKDQNQINQILLAVDSNCQPHIICLLPDYSICHLTKDRNNNWFSSPLVFKTENGLMAHPKYLWLTIDAKDTWHLVWPEKENRLYYTIKPKGEDWQMSVEISQGRELHLGSFFAAALDKKGNLHLAWRDSRSPGPNPIIYAFKPKNGTLSDLVHLTEDSGVFSASERGIRLALFNNLPRVVWVDEGFEKSEEKTGFQSQIIYTAKLKERDWSEPITISNSLGRINREPYLIGSKEALHLVFMSGEWSYGNIFYSFKSLK